jgi:glutamine synthetase type III
MKIKQLDSLTNKLNDVNKKLKISQENINAAKIGREPTKERTEVLEKVAQLKAEEEALLKEIESYDHVEKMKKESQV